MLSTCAAFATVLVGYIAILIQTENMETRPPIVVATLHSNETDINYQIYSQCYGLEMQIDNEWNAELIILAPYSNFGAVVERTDVTGEDTAIVSAGVTDLPATSSRYDTTAVKNNHNNWVLIDASAADSKYAAKLRAATDAGCRVIVQIRDLSPEGIKQMLGPAEGIEARRIIVAISHPDAFKPNVAVAAARDIRVALASTGCAIVVKGKATPSNIGELISLDGIDGVFVGHDDYSDFGDILKLLRKVGG